MLYNTSTAASKPSVEILTPPEDLARLRRLMRDSVSLDAAWAELNDFRNRPTPKATIEAVMHAVRERGLAALKEPVTAERLERCDAAAKAEIEQLITKLRADGLAVLLISSEIEEILVVADRILVMHRGKIAGQLTREEATEARIVALATGGGSHGGFGVTN